MSFETLKKKANLIISKSSIKSQYCAVLLGMILQQTNGDNNIESIINICEKIEMLIDSKQLIGGTEEQVLFLLYQNLHKTQQYDFQSENKNGTPVLSRDASPELKPYQPPKSIQKNQMETEQPQKREIQKWPVYQQEKQQLKAETNLYENSDKGTMELIRMLQEEDRVEQLKLKSMQPQEDDNMDCQICCDSLVGSVAYPLDGCDHVYHQDCLGSYIEQAMKERRIDIKCPDDLCRSKLNEIDIGIICGKEKQTDYNKYTLDQFVNSHGDQMSWCPTADCGFAFVIGEDDEDKDFSCPLCQKRYCLNCRVLFHVDQNCKEYQITNTRDENDVQFEKFVVGKKYKTCTKCKFWVEKNQGCDHMTCRCGYQFCYKCGGLYPNCDCVQLQQAQQQSRFAKQLARQEKLRLKIEKQQRLPQPRKINLRAKKAK